ncbi:MAG: hypothetical protein QXE64_02535 [Candidatus Pacearchaeota archaeon]
MDYNEERVEEGYPRAILVLLLLISIFVLIFIFFKSLNSPTLTGKAVVNMPGYAANYSTGFLIFFILLIIFMIILIIIILISIRRAMEESEI